MVGLPQSIGITEIQLILALLGVLAVDILVERLGYLDRIETQISEIKTKIQSRISANSFFGTRSDLPQFITLLSHSNDIWLSGKSLRGIVTTHGRQIEQAIQQGKRFRFLIPNPNNTSVMGVLASSSFSIEHADSARENIYRTLAYLRRIYNSKTNVEIRVTESAPTNSYIILDAYKNSGQMLVEMYGYKISSSERLHMILQKQEDMNIFNFHLEQFERMWQDATLLES